MVNFLYKASYDVQDLVEIVKILRGPGGCPWDQVQTHESICRDLLEEAYEVVDAIGQKAPAGIKEELGDVLLQVVFHTGIEREHNGLTLDQVADGVCKKLIYRHPHVFGEVTVSGTDEVLSNWEVLKRAEKGQDTDTDALQAVARALPALWRAEKVQKKAEKAGTQWPDTAGQVDKLCGETDRLRFAIQKQGDVQRALGQLLFETVALARRLGVDPEAALTDATDRFICDFRARVEQN